MKVKPRVFVTVPILILLMVYLVKFIFSIFTIKEENLEDRYALIDRSSVNIIYKEKMILRLPLDVYLTKDKHLKEMIAHGEYKTAVNLISNVLPEKIFKYRILPKKNNDKYKVKARRDQIFDMPLIDKSNKKYIDTIKLDELFSKHYYKEKIDLENNKIIIDILNGNGRGGYAKSSGERIKKALSFKYSAANYQEISNYSYLINKNLSSENAQELVMAIPEKYIKIRDNLDITTLANAILILGQENGRLIKVTFISNKIYDKLNYEKLKAKGYYVKRIKQEEVIEEDYIKYNKEDYYTAYKISRVLGISKMVENNGLDNEINVLLNK